MVTGKGLELVLCSGRYQTSGGAILFVSEARPYGGCANEEDRPPLRAATSNPTSNRFRL